MSGPLTSRWDRLRQALERRLAVIADTDWRDRDPVSHLAAIAECSAQIDAAHSQLAATTALPPRLKHFIERASFQKALEFIREHGPASL